MATKNSPSNEMPAANTPEPKHGTRFVEKMFSGFGHETVPRPAIPPRAAEEPYRALRPSTAPSGANYRLPSQHATARVHGLSPATEVMTDLTRVSAVTIPPSASLDEANQAMVTHGVRSLFVVGEANAILGIITSTDVLGERPIQFAQERGMRHAEVLVHHVMTPAAQFEAIELTGRTAGTRWRHRRNLEAFGSAARAGDRQRIGRAGFGSAHCAWHVLIDADCAAAGAFTAGRACREDLRGNRGSNRRMT